MTDLWYLVRGDVSQLEVGVQQGRGGRLRDLAPHQPVLLLDEELMMARSEMFSWL